MSFRICLIDAVPGAADAPIGLAASARRTALLQAVRRHGGVLRALDYRSACEAAALPGAEVYKFDAPGQNEALDHWFLGIGAQQRGEAAPPPRAPGEIHARACWFAGFAAALHRIAVKAPAARWLNSAESILGMTDKWSCQQHLAAHGLRIPPLLGRVDSFAHLESLMAAHGCTQVFVKPRFGSSGSGVIALRRSAQRWQAISSVRLIAGRLFNQLRVRALCDRHAIASLVDHLLAATPCYVEGWIPKPRVPGTADSSFDLRVIAWHGQLRQCIARVAATPISNLHLGNLRIAPHWLSGPQRAAIAQTVSQVAAAFPGAQVCGLDLIVRARDVVVLEVNAFGDHLREVHAADGASAADDQAAHWRALFRRSA